VSKLELLYASDRKAAQLLDMKRSEFCALVDGGHLPGPIDIGGHKRWDVEQLRRINCGDAIDGEIQW
jgi:hypothetical protein